MTIEPPADDWTITPESGTSFETLGASASQTAEWTVTVPQGTSASST